MLVFSCHVSCIYIEEHAFCFYQLNESESNPHRGSELENRLTADVDGIFRLNERGLVQRAFNVMSNTELITSTCVIID